MWRIELSVLAQRLGFSDKTIVIAHFVQALLQKQKRDIIQFVRLQHLTDDEARDQSSLYRLGYDVAVDELAEKLDQLLYYNEAENKHNSLKEEA